MKNLEIKKNIREKMSRITPAKKKKKKKKKKD